MLRPGTRVVVVQMEASIGERDGFEFRSSIFPDFLENGWCVESHQVCVESVWSVVSVVCYIAFVCVLIVCMVLCVCVCVLHLGPNLALTSRETYPHTHCTRLTPH